MPHRIRAPRVDASVVDRARRGDTDAHAELYERFSVDVMTVARRMLGSTARAEDVLQETFVEVIRGVGPVSERLRNRHVDSSYRNQQMPQ